MQLGGDRPSLEAAGCISDSFGRVQGPSETGSRPSEQLGLRGMSLQTLQVGQTVFSTGALDQRPRQMSQTAGTQLLTHGNSTCEASPRKNQLQPQVPSLWRAAAPWR